MGRGDYEAVDATAQQEQVLPDLLCGITPYHIRMLVNDPFSGGGGYTLEEVANMTPYQIMFRMTDPKLLKRQDGRRVVKMSAAEAMALVDKNNMIKVRMADGTLQKRPIGGTSSID